MDAMRISDGPTALAVFVKTPGLSPIKTRLAEGVGRDGADEFFRRSLAAVEATVAMLADSGDIQPYWAVAEPAAVSSARWQQFSRIHQGPGDLGERLGRVFSELQRRHTVVVAIGADSPQITPELVGEAIDHLQHNGIGDSHVLGRCHDGGFYLVGTNHPLPAALWQGVPYSTSSAAACLAANLMKYGPVYELARLTDVDQVADLALLKDELIRIPDPSPAQQAVLQWVIAVISAIR